MKKSLLAESEIRKFMKFANLGTLAENFIENNVVEDVTEDMAEDVTEEVVEETVDDITEEVLTEEDVDVHDFVTALMDVIEDKTGVQITVEKDAAGESELGDEEEMPGDEEMGEPMDMSGEEAPLDAEMAPPEEEEEEEEFPGAGLVEEVVRRVAKRLLKENKK